uniref:PAP-associated domain-containing protein n=1 Tax=Taenia asiatica TaxID=60517 RepID=A0A0R3VW86_TAEAS
LDWSDLDLCFVIPPRELRRRGGAYSVLRDIESLLLRNDFICSCRLIDAKVPILKFRDHESGIECDLNVNNVSGIYNTHLLSMYSRDIFVALRTVFSYAMGITAVVVHTVAPSVHIVIDGPFVRALLEPQLFFCSRRPVEEVYRKLDLPWRKVRSANKSTLGELFAGFIAYYADFDFAHRVISIRRGRPSRIGRRVNCCLPLRKRARHASSFKIFVEGPFRKDNAARSVSGATIFADIQDAFSRTDEVLRAEEPLSFAWADSQSKTFTMARFGLTRDYLSDLSAQIEQFFRRSSQTSETLEKKVEIRNNLQSVISRNFPMNSLHCADSKLFIVGSSVNGFGFDRGDLDLCLVVKEEALESKEYACTVLSEIKPLLLGFGSIKYCSLIRAIVPILKFRDLQSGIACDMGVNNVSSIYNTHLIAMYARVDSRLPPLGVFVKHWALRMRIHGADRGRLNTCSLLLMVIQYLQCGCSPPVLPNLQSLFPLNFDGECPVDELDMDLQLPWDELCSVNRSTLGELFTGFIAYYADFEFDQWAISVRCGQPFPINEVPSWFATFRGRRGRSKYRIFIEEPYRKDNVARSVYRENVETVKRAFKRTNEFLRERKPLEFL